ncbi:ATP-binding protein [Micromonospora rifamycinica]|uniref:AlbA family DNA-binding domain-containing protein n=1 Tax=Micromonospora rifamycinica TaxID=291594 RepID=UPI003420F1EB
MPLDFDSTRAPMTPRDFVDLVLAVKNARDGDEADWIEWKSGLDLGSAKGKASVSRAIVGLANRVPAAASAHCEGRSYLLVGVQPGDVAGIEEVDPAVLENRLRPYLGDDGPRFAPHWVSVEDRSVLVVEVAAPRDGDPVHHIRREGPDVRDGDIFVRRGAKTDRPSSVELVRLFRRAKGAPEFHGIALALAEPSEISTIDFSEEAVEGWLSSTRRRLLASLPRPRVESGNPHFGSFVGESALSAWPHELAAGLTGAISRREEDRTPEQYEDEVKEYLRRCKEALPYVFPRAAAEKLAPIELRISNQTEENYSAVQVVLYIPGTVEAARPSARAMNVARLPTPPRPYGPWDIGPIYAGRGEVGRLRRIIEAASTEGIFIPQHNAKTVEIDNGGSVTMTFSPLDLRPLEQDVPLARVVLLPYVPLGESITASWKATSKSVRGVARGTLEIPLAESPTPISSLVDEEGE